MKRKTPSMESLKSLNLMTKLNQAEVVNKENVPLNKKKPMKKKTTTPLLVKQKSNGIIKPAPRSK
jgi:hypothetical protein